jgi:two-component system chemotaxis response regulator CheB
MAARAHLRPVIDPVALKVEDSHPACVVIPKRSAPANPGCETLIAIGASTGGTEAIREVLIRLPADMPGIVITQHIPKAFSGPFAMRMNAVSDLAVCEAVDGQPILAGHVYIAPGDSHLLVARAGSRYVCKLSSGALVNRHRPSVDVLFRSVAQAAGANAIGVMLTGMGRDGAEGMKEMRDAGAATIAQDEASSVVWGMPGAAVEAGAVQWQCPLLQIADRILALSREVPGMVHRSNASG